MALNPNTKSFVNTTKGNSLYTMKMTFAKKKKCKSKMYNHKSTEGFSLEQG